ncbi:MAG: hypothetical protein GY906_13865 [bacterium]|nr:hypothetical protein [bacterium]
MKTIVVVEDGSRLADQVREHIQASGAKIEVIPTTTRSGALRILDSSQIDCIVADADDGDLEGLNFVSQLLSTAPLASIAFATDDEELLYGCGESSAQFRFVPTKITATILHSVLSANPASAATTGQEAVLVLDILDVVRLVGSSPEMRSVHISSEEGEGLLSFFNGALVHASAGKLTGMDAFLQMVLWRRARIKEASPEALQDGYGHSASPVANLLKDAVGLRMAMITDAFPAIKPPSEEKETNSEDKPEAEIGSWWQRLLVDRPNGVRMVIAHSPNTECHCAKTLTQHLAGDIGAVRNWSSDRGESPGFVRIHPELGGLLSLSVVPMSEKNKFAFESFARSAELVLICRKNYNKLADDWAKRVPYRVRCVIAGDESEHEEGVCTALQVLVEEQE